MMSNELNVTPIGVIRSPFSEQNGTPIQPRFAEDKTGTVEVKEEFAEGLKDLDGFERIWLIYWFDRVTDFKLSVKPYLDETSRGLFATRAPSRPVPIGMSPVKLESISGCTLKVSGIDVLDNTPLLDIKPYSPGFDSFENVKAGWLDEKKPLPGIADSRFEKEK